MAKTFKQLFENFANTEVSLQNKDILNLLRMAIESELDATAFYEQIIQVVDNPKIKSILSDIKSEEQLHVSQLYTALKFYSNSEKDASIKGEDEALESLTDN